MVAGSNMGPYLERVLLAAGEVRGYSRVEHGREEYVPAHEQMLRELAGGAPGKGMGRLRPHDFPLAMDDLQIQLRPNEEQAAKAEIEQAHAAFQAKDYAKAHYHLGMARQVAASSNYNAGYLRRVLTEAQAHMSLREQHEPAPHVPEASGAYPAEPLDALKRGADKAIRLMFPVSAERGDVREGRPGGIERAVAQRKAARKQPKWKPKGPKLKDLV